MTLTTKGNLGQQNQWRLGKKKTPENNIVTTTFIPQHHLQHLIIGFNISSKPRFPHKNISSPPIIKASRRSFNHTLTAASTKALLSPLVDQIPQQPALRVGELDTGQATGPIEEISEDEAESFEDKCTFLSFLYFVPDHFDIDSHNSLPYLKTESSQLWNSSK